MGFHDENETDFVNKISETSPDMRYEDKKLKLVGSSRRLFDSKQKFREISSTAVSSCVASPLGLLEELFANYPWRLLLSTILLNRTRRIQVDVIMFRFLQKWPTPEAVIEADVDEMSKCIAPLGIKYRRAKGIVTFSTEYLNLVDKSRNERQQEATNNVENQKEDPATFQWTRGDITSLFHCGDYAADAYEIFIKRNWTNIHPRDHALLAYVEWKQSKSLTSQLP